MSEILIPNVDLPKKEEDATYLRIDSYGHVFQYDHRTIEMRTIAKVVELPPHGDLVDRQKLIKALSKAWDVDDDQDFANKSVWRIVEKEAPTIIEASKNGEGGVKNG